MGRTARVDGQAAPTGRSVGSSWLALGEASRMLGVDPDTLRRWSDGGRIRTFTTPGGHRRFERVDVDRVREARRAPTTRRPPQAPPLESLGVTAQRVEAAYRRRFPAGRAPLAGTWLDRLAESERVAFRMRGRRLQALLLRHVGGSDPEDDGQDSLRQAETLGAEYGVEAARMGIPLAEAVAAFLASRDPFLSELASVVDRRHLPGGEAARLLVRAGRALDRVLLALVDAHGSFELPDPRSAHAPVADARTSASL